MRSRLSNFRMGSSGGFMVGAGVVCAIAGLTLRPAGAGDILRGGAPANARSAAGSDGRVAAQAAQARANARDTLARTTEAVQAVQKMQQAARAAAASQSGRLGANPNFPGQLLPVVPNGLAPGGLQLSGSPVGALNPVQSGGGGRTTVTVKQTAQQALLEWSSFNLGSQTTLRFDQKAGGANKNQWIAFNKVNDPSGAPSQILGSIQADGQVYVINQNGIIFGGTSQVNAHTLVASALPINSNLVDRGLLNNPDAQFLFSSLALPAGSKGTPAFTPPASFLPGGRTGDVTVMAGAHLESPTTADGVGGRIALLGANVTNQGTLSTTDGQTILAAGLQVGWDAHLSSDATLRGLDTYVGAVVDPASTLAAYAGRATNQGQILAPRGNVTIAGQTVDQLGVIDSSTSVSLNGRIDLLASYDAVGNIAYDATNASKGLPFLNRASGTLTLGPGSAMRVLPEWDSDERVVGSKLPLTSRVNLQGRAVRVARDSTLLAPNAEVTLNAGVWDFIPSVSAANPPRSQFVNAGGQVYLEPGALISVAGSTDISVPISQNILTLELRGAEFADSPLQRGGVLRGQSITIDIRQSGIYNGLAWVGTPLANAAGYVGLIERSVGELTTAGGSVTITAGESVVLQPGSKIDVSAGWINYEGGTIRTTRLLAGGRLVDIAQATPDRVYDGIYTGLWDEVHPKWSVTHTYANALAPTGEHFEMGYLFGGAGGQLPIRSPAMALDGILLGQTIIGPRQRTTMPDLSALTLNFQAQKLDAAASYPLYAPTPPTVVFESGAALPPAGPFALDPAGHPLPLRDDRRQRVVLAPELLTEGGFGSLRVENPDGNITIPAGVTVEAGPRGAITLLGANVTVRGRLSAPGGTLGLTAYNISPSEAAELRRLGALAVTPPPNSGRGSVTLGTGASLSAAGLIVDDRLSAPAPLSLPIVTTGGQITIDGFNAWLARGSEIDVSGGVTVAANGRRTYGDGGRLSIRTGRDVSLPSVLGGEIELRSTLRGYSGGRGGALTIQASLIQIGGRSLYPGTLQLMPDFFSSGGFTTFTLNGIGEAAEGNEVYHQGLVIAPGTLIAPVPQNYLAVLYGLGASSASLTPVTLPVGLRTPVSLNFGVLGAIDEFSGQLKVRGDFVMGEGARVETGPRGSIGISANTVAVFGSLIAPGGAITLTGASRFPTQNADPVDPLPTLLLGSRSLLSTRGVRVLTPDAYGRRVGTVLPGGSITVSGNIVALPGSVIDVSGASDILDLHPNFLGRQTTPLVRATSGINDQLYSLQTVPTRVDSDGGSISLRGGQMLFSEAQLRGDAGGPTALGGNLLVTSGRFYRLGVVPIPTDVTLTVTQNGSVLPAGQGAIGQPVRDLLGNVIPGQGYFAVDRFNRGGFDALTLGGVVNFDGPVTINAARSLSVASGGVLYADDAVNLTAPYVALGQPFLAPFQPQEQVLPFTLAGLPYYFPPTYGSGRLTVQADLIDVGNLSLQGIGLTRLIARRGDIRGNGTLDVAGSLYLEAGQIYPATGVSFTLAAHDYTDGGVSHPGSVVIVGSGARQVPLSAGGQLNVFASSIHQGGTLRAPFGSITLGWDGTGTPPKGVITGQPVPVTDDLTLAAGSVTSVSGIDPRTGLGMLIPYGLNLNGSSWIDPAGTDITATGSPAKTVSISAANVTTEAGSIIDIRGGGDLYSYRWVPGNGGSRDILASSTSFAVIPGYQANFAPYAPFNGSAAGDATLAGDPGYGNSTLRVGDQVYLGASAGLRAGTYTLLPARYALLPGAVLVTPQSGTPVGTVALPDGSSLVSGYRFNNLNSSREVPEIFGRFEVAPAAVVRARAQYADYLANAFFAESAAARSVAAPRLPIDSGQLILAATRSMSVRGDVLSMAPPGARGGLIDISSPVDILIAGAGASGAPGQLVLDSAQLSGFGAESLLIGGTRRPGPNGSIVAVKTNRLTVDTAGAPLTGSDIILVSNESLVLAPGSEIRSDGSTTTAVDPLVIGESAVAGSGNGTLLRVSADAAATVTRLGVGPSTLPAMTIGAGSTIAGGSIILDSTSATALDPTASLRAQAITLNSGQISLQLNAPGDLLPTTGLVLAGHALQDLQAARSVRLQSYSSLDIYGTGMVGTPSLGRLVLSAADIRGFNAVGGTASFLADEIMLENGSGRPALGAVAAPAGSIEFVAKTIRLGVNQLQINQYAAVGLRATEGVVLQDEGGLTVAQALEVTAPVLVGATGANQSLTAGGAITMQTPSGGGGGTIDPGLGARLAITGESLVQGTDILLPSGLLSLRATSGDLVINGRLDAGGRERAIHDLVKFTDGGEITLRADAGNLTLGPESGVSVAAAPGGGNAGTLSLVAPQGSLTLQGSLAGAGGMGGAGGRFSLDLQKLPTTAGLNLTLDQASFSTARVLRVRAGDVQLDGAVTTRDFRLAADAGSIVVTGSVDASGTMGGSISLEASGALVVAPTARLTVAGTDFSAAGKGGSVTLGTRGESGAVLDLQAGSIIDLSVASASPESAARGQFSGTLHLRAPQTAGQTDLQLNPLAGTILGASHIVAEGYQVFDLSATGGSITDSVQGDVRAGATAFLGAAGTTTPGYTAMRDRLLAGQPGLESVFVLQPGAELVNGSGDLTLGASNSTPAADWDLSTFRFGPRSAPGTLTLRASGNLVFFNALSDGFDSSAYTASLLARNPMLPGNAQSWSYRLTAGADLTAANAGQVRPLGALAAGTGSLLLGKNAGINIAVTPGANAQTNTAVTPRFQVIRTGTGDIQIDAGRDVQLLNQFATIYTAGARVDDPTQLPGGSFDVPVPNLTGNQGTLGAIQQIPAHSPQYSLGGGNIAITAGGDIAHLTRTIAGTLIPDSQRQLPTNWLYRRGFVDPATGGFGVSRFGETASTTWWVDFSNFFQGVGALGGGNVSLTAAGNVSNVDAVVPTNARMPKNGPIVAANLFELGGGDLSVRAGRDIDGGVYYVERGQGVLQAGGSIHTNATRSPSLITITNSPPLPEQTWLPTTLFLGKGAFDVSARGDLLLGPTANPFLLPGGYNNTFWYKSYFSTYAAESAVTATSLTGDLTLRTSTTLPNDSSSKPILLTWLENVSLLKTSTPPSVSFYQPWLRLNETSVAPFATVSSLMPGSLRATAFGGDINLAGNLTLSPSPQGALELVANGALNGLQGQGVSNQVAVGSIVQAWGTSRINLSDANPASVPGLASPFAYQTIAGTVQNAARQTGTDFLLFVDALFNETGSTQGVLQTKQALHAPGLLHLNNPDPVRLYAGTGDVSGLTLFSGKAARVLAGRDVTDLSLYVQNVNPGDISLVASGRDIVAYNANSPLRIAATSIGNALNVGEVPLAGDLQISGPGTWQVLAGRHLDLGNGPNNPDRTGLGLVSIGNARNPGLPFEGADIIAGAGVGGPAGLENPQLGFEDFIAQFVVNGGAGGFDYLAQADALAAESGGGSFVNLPVEQQNIIALEIFYRILRDAGRSFATTGNYDSGFAAIQALFPTTGTGDISLTSREIKTQSGGNLHLFAPGGKITVGLDVSANQALDQGILTEAGGDISIFADQSVVVGTSRIFTLRGGNEIIWSSTGDIAAGASSKTVQSAPPTRVLIDPQSADVKTDLAGLATGGGIGVLATVAGVPPGDVDLVAPGGTVDAGDAGIRVSGNITIAASQVLNASNIAVSGTSAGTPAAPAAPASPPSAPASASNAQAANDATTKAADQQRATQSQPPADVPSIISVEVLGYGGADRPPEEDEEDEKRRRDAPPSIEPPPPKKGSG